MRILNKYPVNIIPKVTGNFIVTDTGKATDEEINSATPTCTGMCRN